MYSHVACDVMKERTLYLLKPSSLIWHLMPYLFLFIFEPKNYVVTEISFKALLNFSPLECTYLGKNHFNIISALSEKMKLKSGHLELWFSVYIKYIFLSKGRAGLLDCFQIYNHK